MQKNPEMIPAKTMNAPENNAGYAYNKKENNAGYAYPKKGKTGKSKLQQMIDRLYD